MSLSNPSRIAAAVLVVSVGTVYVVHSSAPTTTVTTPAFIVAPNGNDSNPGTLAAPFATLAKAQTAMRGSSTKTTFLRAGTYSIAPTGTQCVSGYYTGLSLSSSDAGTTWAVYPGDGVGAAILDGGSSGVGVGTGCGISVAGSNITIQGLTFQNFRVSAIRASSATGVGIYDVEVTKQTEAPYDSGAISVLNSPLATIRHNYVHDVPYFGIEIADNMTNVDVEQNIVINSCDSSLDAGGSSNDCGAIYAIDRSHASYGVYVRNNYVRDINKNAGGTGGRGLYLDDGTCNVTAIGNVVGPVVGSCFFIHGGCGNIIENNICDLGTSGNIVLYTPASAQWTTTMAGNRFVHNLVVSYGSTAGYVGPGSGTPTNSLTIKNNAYHAYAGSPITTTGTAGVGDDSNPVLLNPGLSDWGYSCPAISSISFAPIAGGWLALPHTGTTPSHLQ